MKKKAIYYITIILTMLLFILSTYSYAAELTKEALTEFINEYKNQEREWENVQVTDNEIIISKAGEEQKIRYDLTAKPTFCIDLEFKDGMSYNECLDEEGKIVDLTLGFAAVAYVKGIELEDAMIYGLSTVATKIEELQNSTINKNNYTNAIEYGNKKYGLDMTANEELFDMKTKKGILNGKIYTVTVELIVNSEKDFSILNGKFNQATNTVTNTNKGNVTTVTNVLVVEGSNTIIDNSDNKQNILSKEEISETPLPTDSKDNMQEKVETDKEEESTTQETKSDVIKPVSTANITKMPNAGFAVNLLNIVKVILGLGIGAFIVYWVYNKRYSEK